VDPSSVLDCPRSLASQQESTLDASHQLAQVWFGNLVIDPSTLPLAGEEPASLQQPQMFRRNIVGNLAVFGQFTNRVATVQ
jgi:hypothetical protein